jgi:hypothetical protein
MTDLENNFIFIGEGACRKVYKSKNSNESSIFIVKIDKPNEPQNKLELDAYLFVAKNKPEFLKYLPTVEGFVLIDQLEALKVEFIDGVALANYLSFDLDLKDLIRRRMEEFFGDALKNGVCIWDANLDNFIYKVKCDRLYIVDGLISREFGFKYWVRKNFKIFSNMKTKQTAKKIALDLGFDTIFN